MVITLRSYNFIAKNKIMIFCPVSRKKKPESFIPNKCSKLATLMGLLSITQTDTHIASFLCQVQKFT